MSTDHGIPKAILRHLHVIVTPLVLVVRASQLTFRSLFNSGKTSNNLPAIGITYLQDDEAY